MTLILLSSNGVVHSDDMGRCGAVMAARKSTTVRGVQILKYQLRLCDRCRFTTAEMSEVKGVRV